MAEEPQDNILDWLDSLGQTSEGPAAGEPAVGQPAASEPAAEEPALPEELTRGVFGRLMDNISGRAAEEDVVDELRDQFAMPDDDLLFDREPRSGLARTIRSLQPWQRFVLTVMLFLDVLVCGMMFLVMMNKLWLF